MTATASVLPFSNIPFGSQASLGVEFARTALKESSILDFKSTLNFKNQQEKCELIKDIIAMANSGGGLILIGVDDSGAFCSYDPLVNEIDCADVANVIFKYTGKNFVDFTLTEIPRLEVKRPAFLIGPSEYPIVFTETATFDVSKGKTERVFNRGSIYFRHGPKSEPANSDDLRAIIDRIADQKTRGAIEHFIDSAKKVATFPPGATIQVITNDVQHSKSPDATPIRLTNDPSAPAYRAFDYDDTHPYRACDIVNEINKSTDSKINSYDFQVLSKQYNFCSNPEFFHQAKFSPKQYSPALLQWVLSKLHDNPKLFCDARDWKKRQKGPKKLHLETL